MTSLLAIPNLQDDVEVHTFLVGHGWTPDGQRRYRMSDGERTRWRKFYRHEDLDFNWPAGDALRLEEEAQEGDARAAVLLERARSVVRSGQNNRMERKER